MRDRPVFRCGNELLRRFSEGGATCYRPMFHTVTDIGYTGHRHNNLPGSDLGLVYMNARFYVSSIGRFASADTIVPDPPITSLFTGGPATYFSLGLAAYGYAKPAVACWVKIGKFCQPISRKN